MSVGLNLAENLGGVGIPTSLLPRPKPFMMGPERRMGKGGMGPSGDPTAVGVRIVVFFILGVRSSS